MKLFAVGTREPNPNKWNAWDGVELYIATNKEEAIDMAGNGHYDYEYPSVEVDMRMPTFVMSMPDYIDDMDMGD